MNIHPIRNATSIAVAGATNAIPIVVTTAAAHQLVTGETVDINGVRGNLNTNGVDHVVTVASSTTFSLAGIKGSGEFVGVEGTVTSKQAQAAVRDYPAVTAAEGSIHAFPTINQSARFNFYVEATADPTGGGTAGVDVRVYGRTSGDSDWFQVQRITGTTGTWAQVGSGRWMNKALDLPAQPQLRMDVVSWATSTTDVRGWIAI